MSKETIQKQLKYGKKFFVNNNESQLQVGPAAV